MSHGVSVNDEVESLLLVLGFPHCVILGEKDATNTAGVLGGPPNDSVEAVSWRGQLVPEILGKYLSGNVVQVLRVLGRRRLADVTHESR